MLVCAAGTRIAAETDSRYVLVSATGTGIAFRLPLNYCVEIFQRGFFVPYWERTNNNGAGIYTKLVPPPIMKRLRPGITNRSKFGLYDFGPSRDVRLELTKKLQNMRKTNTKNRFPPYYTTSLQCAIST